MPIMRTVRQPSSMSKLYVYIDGYNGLNFCGRLYIFNGSAEVAFDSMVDMLKAADGAFDSLSFPQAVYKGRSFDESADEKMNEMARVRKMEQTSGDAEHESKATFIIHVKFRQNSTWQGEIKWVDRHKVQYFRSSLEMIKLMDMALAEEFGQELKVEWK